MRLLLEDNPGNSLLSRNLSSPVAPLLYRHVSSHTAIEVHVNLGNRLILTGPGSLACAL